MGRRGGNRRHNFATKLPPEIKEQLDKMIVDGVKYEEITAWLAKFDVNLHRSTVNKYGQRYLDKLERIKVLSEQSRAVFEDNKGKPATELADASVLIVTQMLMEQLMNDESIDLGMLTKAATALAGLQRSSVKSEKLKFDVMSKVKLGLTMFTEEVSKTLAGQYPELQERLAEIAEEIADKIEA